MPRFLAVLPHSRWGTAWRIQIERSETALRVTHFQNVQQKEVFTGLYEFVLEFDPTVSNLRHVNISNLRIEWAPEVSAGAFFSSLP